MIVEVVTLASELIAAESVTPARGRVFDVLEAALVPLGFVVERFVAGEAPDGPVENLLATRGSGAPHLAFAGHLDVVPGGDGWTAGAFVPDIRGDLLHGRGAVDMKGAIAAFVVAAAQSPDEGTLTLIITGDEEGPAIFGTIALIERMQARGLAPDLCLVGEPTSVDALGDMVKIGRRGSVNIWIEVPGRPGHVAYPHLADNPIPRLVTILTELDQLTLDAGSAWFQPSNLEITDITVGNNATNVIPARASARLSIRFNDLHSGEALVTQVTAIVRRHSPDAIVTARISGEAFLTTPGLLSTLVSDAIHEVTGRTPALSTTGGTSDARFLRALCPVVEFGLLNATMHKTDEAVAIADLEQLVAIYGSVIRKAQALD